MMPYMGNNKIDGRKMIDEYRQTGSKAERASERERERERAWQRQREVETDAENREAQRLRHIRDSDTFTSRLHDQTFG